VARGTSWRTAALTGAMTLVAALACAQGTGPGVRSDPGIPAAQMPGVLSRVEFEQRLNEQLPLDLMFTDETGRAVPLRQYFGSRPVILSFVYYECPMLCTQVLNGLAGVLDLLPETAGKEFEVVTLSFDPRETSVLAAAKKKVYLERYNRPAAAQGWHFLTGSEASIAALTKAAGFHYAWDEATGQFAHASGVVVVNPDGRVSRYFFGIDYAARDLKFALMESSEGRIGAVADKLLLYCYHYDPNTGQYSFVAMRAVRIGAATTLVALLGFMAISIRREHRSAGH